MNIKQFKSAIDNCVYFYDEILQKWRKICDIPSPRDLPMDVRVQVREAQNEADYILSLPLDEDRLLGISQGAINDTLAHVHFRFALLLIFC